MDWMIAGKRPGDAGVERTVSIDPFFKTQASRFTDDDADAQVARGHCVNADQ